MGSGAERWLLTYSDMITLLLALFVILFALSSISPKKFVAFKEGLNRAFSHVISSTKGGQGLLQQTSLVNTPGSHNQIHVNTNISGNPIASRPLGQQSPASPGVSQPPPGSASLSQIYSQIHEALQQKGLLGDVNMTSERRGVVVRVLADKVFYASDHATLSPVGDDVVDTVAQVLRSDTNDVMVEGYTDSQPITGGPYTSNWELSSMRAVNVLLRLVRVDGIDENRLAAVGYGKTRPIVPNTTAANMAMNRRVDIVVLAPGQGNVL